MSTSRAIVLERLCKIANLVGAPTMDYAPEVAIREMRARLDIVAAETAALIRLLIADEREQRAAGIATAMTTAAIDTAVKQLTQETAEDEGVANSELTRMLTKAVEHYLDEVMKGYVISPEKMAAFVKATPFTPHSREENSLPDAPGKLDRAAKAVADIFRNQP